VVAGPVVADVVGDPNFGVDGSAVVGVGGPVVPAPAVGGAGGGSVRFMMSIA
jgi:hypothetical protein